jgi:hypothetical protein
MESNRLLGFARVALSVVRQVDRLLAGPSIEKARRAMIDAERRQNRRRTLEGLGSGAVAAAEFEIQEEFIDEIGGVQVPVTSHV